MNPTVETGIGLVVASVGLGVLVVNVGLLRHAVRVLRSRDTLDTTTVTDGTTRTVTGTVQPHPESNLLMSPCRLDAHDSVFCEWAVDRGNDWGRVEDGHKGTLALIHNGAQTLRVDFSSVTHTTLSHDQESPLYFEDGGPQTALETFLQENSEYTPRLPDFDPRTRRVISKSLTPGDAVTISGTVVRTDPENSHAGVALTNGGTDSNGSSGRLRIHNWSVKRAVTDVLLRVVISVFSLFTLTTGVLMATTPHYTLPYQSHTTAGLLISISFVFAYVWGENILYRLIGTQSSD